MQLEVFPEASSRYRPPSEIIQDMKNFIKNVVEERNNGPNPARIHPLIPSWSPRLSAFMQYIESQGVVIGGGGNDNDVENSRSIIISTSTNEDNDLEQTQLCLVQQPTLVDSEMQTDETSGENGHCKNCGLDGGELSQKSDSYIVYLPPIRK